MAVVASFFIVVLTYVPFKLPDRAKLFSALPALAAFIVNKVGVSLENSQAGKTVATDCAHDIFRMVFPRVNIQLWECFEVDGADFTEVIFLPILGFLKVGIVTQFSRTKFIRKVVRVCEKVDI